MVLSKRNANGEFVVWNSSSQASNNGTVHAESSSPLKRARLATPNNADATSPSTKSSAPAQFRTVQRRASSPDFEVKSCSSKTPMTATTKSGDMDFASSVRQVAPTKANASTSSAGIGSVSSSSLAQKSAETHQGSSLHQIRSTPPAPPKRSRRKTAALVSPDIPVETPRAAQPSTIASTSALPSIQPSPPATNKRGRKKATEPAPKPEKRGAIFKKKCPQNILDRVERVMTQRIFMIDRNRVEGELKEEFSVLGSTGNVYTVVIDHRPRCNCPDASKGNHCKHILFIFLKVLQVTQDSGYWYQKALLTSELEDIFAHAPLAPNSMAHPHVREAYARATGKALATSTTPAVAPGKKRLPGPEDDCPICYDGMHGVAETSLVFCADCGNALHKECFQQWQRTAVNSRKNLTCVWCRAPWAVPLAGPVGGAAGGARRGQGGYLNLAGVGGLSPVRDTSTYYHGPRRGQHHFGYQYYPDD